MVFTTNKPLSVWGQVLHDADLAHAIVDRVLERGRLLRLDGPSLRIRHLGLDDPAGPEAASAQVVRVSGIQSSEFPEPTCDKTPRLMSTPLGVGLRSWCNTAELLSSEALRECGSGRIGTTRGL